MSRSGMAHQLAKLLASGDLDELREVVARWKEGAVTNEERRLMDEMGTRILDVKAVLARAPRPPTEDELEEMLRVMLLLASDPGAVKPPQG